MNLILVNVLDHKEQCSAELEETNVCLRSFSDLKNLRNLIDHIQ